MQRDLMTLPDDDNGDALWQAVQKGLSLGEAHRVRFSVAFPKHVNAFQFGCFLLRQGYWVQVNEAEGDAGDEVLLEMGLNVTHDEISGAETWLREHAAELDGLPAGWEIRDLIERAVHVHHLAP